VKPPSAEQLAAAARIYQAAGQWRWKDRTLRLAHEEVPGHGAEAVLHKTTMINALYSTNIHAIARVAEHLATVLGSADLTSADPDLVERMAHVPAGSDEQIPRRRYNLASKYAHFFIAPDRFPVWDRSARTMVRIHNGVRAAGALDVGYVSFAAGFEHLRRTISPSPAVIELDHYLLIAGQAIAFRLGRWENIGAELRGLFSSHPDEVEILAPLA